MMDRTKIVPNHVDGEYDVRWSVLIKLAVWFTGIIASVATAALIAMAALGFTTVQKLNIIDERQQMVIANQKEMRADLKAVKDYVASEDYLTHGEFNQWMTSTQREKAIHAIITGSPDREVPR